MSSDTAAEGVLEIMKIKVIPDDFKVDLDRPVNREGLIYYDIDSKPFKLHGVWKMAGCYSRVPADIAEKTSSGVMVRGKNPAGGRLRFKTDSKRVAIIAKYENISKAGYMAVSASRGFDLYEGKYFLGTFIPPMNMPNMAYESMLTLDDARMRELTLNFPIYSDVSELYVGIDEGASLEAADDYTYKTPVVFYGSSITQGGCASRPGSIYPAHLSRWLDCDFISFGFSGSCKAELPIIDYINTFDMSVLVCDYDYNAPDPEYLEATHLRLYRRVREGKPNLPIIFISMPTAKRTDDVKRRFEIIKNTYDTAKSEGDNNVYLLNGGDFFPFESNEFTVDDCHPTDMGFYFMAKGIYPTLKELVEGNVDEQVDK